MNKALIFGDNLFGDKNRLGIGRSTGSHRAATLFRKYDFDVEVIDFFSNYTYPEIENILNLYLNEDLKFVGFGASLYNFNPAVSLKIVSHIRKHFPKTKIIAGGTNAFFKGVVAADLYFEGFIEGAIVEIINWILDKPNNLIIETLNNYKIVNCTKNYPIKNLDDLETVYTAGDFIDSNESLVLEFSRGCIFKCKFCDFPLLGKKKNDYIRDEKSILNEIKNNYEKFGITKYILADDTFNDNEIKVDMIYNISKQLDFKIEFMGFLRADLLYSRPGSLEKLIDAGLKAVHFGIETFDPRSSQAIGKGFNGKKLKDYLAEVKEKYPDFRIHGSFIAGLPYESLESFEEGINWCNDSQLVDSWTIYPLTIPAENNFSFTSYFSQNWLMYGYSALHKDSKLIYWKNKHTNYYEVIKYAKEIKKRKYSNKKMNPWVIFAITGLGYNIKEYLSMNSELLNSKDIIDKTSQFIKEYKAKKYNHIFSKINS